MHSPPPARAASPEAPPLPFKALKAALGQGLAQAQLPAGLPPDLEAWSPRQWQQAGREVLALHEAYTARQGPFAHEQNPIHEHLAGYQCYFMPRNLYRVYYLLHQLPWLRVPLRELLAPWTAGGPAGSAPAGGGMLDVLDLGCGTGAFSLAWLCWLAASAAREGVDPKELPTLRLTLVDQGQQLMGVAEATLRAAAARLLPGLGLQVERRPDGVERYLEQGAGQGRRFAIVGSALMLNELDLLESGRRRHRAVRMITPLKQLARPGGLILLAEAGTRRGYMNLMAVRDELLPAPILYPCPHNGPCPLWDARVSRWCHATRPLPAPFFFDAQLKRHGGLTFALMDLNLAGLAVQAGTAGQAVAPFHPRPGARIVSGRLPARGPAQPQNRAQPQSRAQPKGGAQPKDKPRPGSARPASAARVVLECGATGQVREIPDPRLSAYPRGLWLPAGSLPEQWSAPAQAAVPEVRPHRAPEAQPGRPRPAGRPATGRPQARRDPRQERSQPSHPQRRSRRGRR